MTEGCIRLPLSRYPGMNRFVLDWLEGEQRATRLLPRENERLPRLINSRSTAGRQSLLSSTFLDALIESNRRWGSFVGDEIRRWAAGETVTIIAGQQVGFAGGPLYTLAKIASLVKMRRQLEAGGTRATLFFWLATEDHDYEEAGTLRLPVASIPLSKTINRQLDLLSLHATPAVESRAVVGPLPIPDPLIAELLALYDMPRPSWLREGITFGDSFAELLVSAVGEKVVYVDSLLPELRRAAAPVFESILASWDEIHAAVASSSRELERSGYTPQITQRHGEYTLLFRLDEKGERHMLGRPEPLGDAATLSTSALTRPLVQDFVFQPDVFMGGPAEVAYCAQQMSLHEMLAIPMPAVALRGHVLVAPRRLMRTFSRYGIDPAVVFGNLDDILSSREPKGVGEIKSLARKARRDLADVMTRIGDIALPAEHALARALNRSIGHIEYHFEKLTERAIRALVRKDRQRHAAVRELVATFYPDRHVQDRVVGWFAWWCPYGKHLVGRIVEEIEPDTASFKMIGL